MKTARKRKQPPPLRSLAKWKLPSQCPGCDEKETFVESTEESIYEIRGEEISCTVPKYFCTKCGCSFMSPDQATQGVKIAVAAYQLARQLLTGEEVASQRKALNLTTDHLAAQSGVGEATIKRLEAGGHLVNTSINQSLKSFFENSVAEPARVGTVGTKIEQGTVCVDGDNDRWALQTGAFVIGSFDRSTENHNFNDELVSIAA